jgi:hypothetical protein
MEVQKWIHLIRICMQFDKLALTSVLVYFCCSLLMFSLLEF